MRISILGCGWLGMALGKRLNQEADFQVNGSTTTGAKIAEINSSGMEGFLVDLENNSPTAFFECDVLVCTIPPSVYLFEEKIKKAIALISEAGVKHVVFISTSSVYPSLNREVQESDADYITSAHSGVNMLAIEDLFRKVTAFTTTTVRFAGLYGPKRAPGRFLAGKQDLKGASSPVNLIHLDDCVEIITQIIKKGVWGETFNACSDGHPTRKAFYTKAAQSLGLTKPTFSDVPADFKVVDSTRLKAALGYTLIHPDPMLDL